jgi:hypothetical protein
VQLERRTGWGSSGRMCFFVGTVESFTDEGQFGPKAVLHGIRADAEFTGFALCGAAVRPWPVIDFPTPTASRNCEICAFAVDFEDE